MLLSESINATRNQVKEWQKEGLSVGFVPTMGYLHRGHASLMARARQENDKVVVSIFVNPTQFAPGEDLGSYPRDLKGDCNLCQGQEVDLVFAPSVEEMYPEPSGLSMTISGLAKELCGKSRPNHFSGVCLVVSKLFHIVPANRAYFGQKDAQQLAIIKKMAKDLNFDLEVVGCPIVRETDGLALSSRNTYLNAEERAAALILSQTLKEIHVLLAQGEKNGDTLRKLIPELIAREPLARLDYGEVVDSETLVPVEYVGKSVLVALAVYIGGTRLIDNITYDGG